MIEKNPIDSNSEKRALNVSIYGNLICIALGFGFAFLTDSGAILLDGFYSLISLLVAILALRVSILVERPPDKHMPFGYGHFEPIFNTLRSLLIIAGSVYALISSVAVILQGGHSVAYGSAVIYGVLCTTICFAIAAHQQNASKKTTSPIISLDAKSWLIDGLITLVTTFAFLLGVLLQEGRFTEFIPYIDPSLIILLVLIVLPIPIKMFGSNTKEVLQFAASGNIQTVARKRLDKVLDAYPVERTDVRIMKAGRYVYLTVYVLMTADGAEMPLSELDKIRKKVAKSFKESKWRYFIDIMFTMDAEDLI